MQELPQNKQSRLNLNDLDNIINHTISTAKTTTREAIRKIHPALNTYYNSINILVGRQNSGKTYTVLKELIKIAYVDDKTHLLVYVTKDGVPNDATFSTLEHLLTVPVLFVAQDEAEEIVKNILAYKNLYNRIKAERLEKRIIEEQINELKTVLMIPDLTLPFLHTVIFFEDSANNPLFKKPTLFFPQLVAKCRHVGVSFFFAVQFWKSLPTELKANISTIYFFVVHYILNQIPLAQSFDCIYAEYQRLKQHDKIIVDVILGETSILEE
jgi:uncharacterized protein YdhG (YjbR/CyaY superfamily)